MERMLQKMAHQLDGMDEASLMALWNKYANAASRFEPTQDWEEACLIFSLIQAKHFKNQLFNYCWKRARQPDAPQKAPARENAAQSRFDIETPSAPAARNVCRVLSFHPPAENNDGGGSEPGS